MPQNSSASFILKYGLQVGCATTHSIPGKLQLPLNGPEAQLKIILSAEQSEQTYSLKTEYVF